MGNVLSHLTHTGWSLSEPLVLFSASAASAAAFFSSNSSLLRTGPLRPSSTRLWANFLLYKTEEQERVWSRRGDEACREGRAQHGRRAANEAPMCLQIMLQICAHTQPRSLCFSGPAGILSSMISPFEEPLQLHLSLGIIS